jgi:hypothetical protein
MYRSCTFGLVACLFELASIAPSVGKPVCRPILTIESTHLAAMQPLMGERKWTAIVSANASRCTTTAGYFELGFSRLKENGLELEFREQFIWSSPSVTVGLDFWADEAVEAVWFDKIDSCPCRE